MARTLDLRQLKDQAARAAEKRNYARAAELYLEIAEHEDQPDWRQRAGEALRKDGRPAEAARELAHAADGYAQGGFLLKAIAVCKLVLQIDPSRREIQSRLAELYAERDRSAAPAPRSVPAPPPPTPVAVAPPVLMSIDELDAPPRPPAGAPMDALPLCDLLGGRRLERFDTTAETSSAWEIALDDVIEVSLSASALPRIPLFSALAPAELTRLIEGVEVGDFSSGQAIVRQGEAGVALYVIVRGDVRVVDEGPGRRTLASLGEGEFFGELALLSDFPRSATVEAREPTQVLEISRELVNRVVADSPEVLKVLLRFFRDRLLDRLLATSPLFARFSPADARAIVERFRFLEIEPGLRLITAGERAPGLYLFLCGTAWVEREGAEVARLGPGDLCGEISLLERHAAELSVGSMTKCWALELERARFQEMISLYPQLLEYLAEVAASRKPARVEVL